MSDDSILSDEQLVLLRSASMLRYFSVVEVAKHAHIDPKDAEAFFASHDDLFESNPNPEQSNFKWDICVKKDKVETITNILGKRRLRLNIRVAELGLDHADRDIYRLSSIAAYLLEARKITGNTSPKDTPHESLLSRLAEAERQFVSLRDATPIFDEFNQPVNSGNAEMRGFAKIFEVSPG